MKPRLFFAGLVMVMLSCSGSGNQSNEQVVKQMFDYFNQHNWAKMAELYGEQAEFLDPSLGTEYVKQTRQQIVEKYSGMEQMFPDIHDEVLGIYSSGDKVFVEFVSTGTSGDSIQFKLPIASVLTVANGKIVRDATYYDNQ